MNEKPRHEKINPYLIFLMSEVERVEPVTKIIGIKNMTIFFSIILKPLCRLVVHKRPITLSIKNAIKKTRKLRWSLNF